MGSSATGMCMIVRGAGVETEHGKRIGDRVDKLLLLETKIM